MMAFKHAMFVALSLLLLSACKSDGPSADDLKGQAYKEGDKVSGKYKGSEKLKRGKIRSLYGPVALIDFNNGRRHWTDLKDLEPKGAYQRPAKDDKCEFEKDDRVKARRSFSGRTMSGKRMSSMHKGKVLRVYGKIGQVQYKDGLDWAYCSEMKKDDSPEDEPGAAKTSAKKKSSGGRTKGDQCRSKCSFTCKGAKSPSKCRKQCKAACPR